MSTGANVTFEGLINQALAELPQLPAREYTFEHRSTRKRALDATLLSRAAQELELTVTPLTEEMEILSDGRRRLGFHQNMPWSLTALDRQVTNDKELTKRILASNGLPVARGRVVHSLAEARAFFGELAAPVVVKPITGSGGRGITVDVRTPEELAEAVTIALSHHRRLLIEESIPCVDLRIMVVAGRAIAAVLRVPANVVGDGKSTIEELVAQKNALRAKNAYLKHAPLELSPAVQERLREKGLSPVSILPPGQRVFLHYKANVSSGGDSYNVSGHLHDDFLRLAERAAASFGSMRHAGVDLLATDLRKPIAAQRCVVCEVNANNDMPLHVFPMFGDPVDVGRLEVLGYFQESRWSRLRHRTIDLVTGRASRSPQQQHATPVRVTAKASLSEWPQLADLLAKPCQYGEEAGSASSVRELDEQQLAKAFADQGAADSVRFRNRLAYLRQGEREMIVERSGADMFTIALSRRPDAIYRLLREADLPSCFATRISSRQWEKAQNILEKKRGPWNLRPGPHTRIGEGVYGCHDQATLEQAWSELALNARTLLLQQAPEQLAFRVLLIDDQVASCQLLVPVGLVGDGVSTAAELLAEKINARLQHPFFRHHPLPEQLLESAPAQAAGLTPDSVLPAGQWVPLATSPVLVTQLETIGFRGCPVPDLPDVAQTVRSLVGNPPMLSVDFAARLTARGRTRWAVSGLDPDPVLAQFVWPWAGDDQQHEVYSMVVSMLLNGQKYTLQVGRG